MGGKRNRERKFFYLCIASLIFLIGSGCSIFQEKPFAREEMIRSEKKSDPKENEPPSNPLFEHLGRARSLLRQRDYEASLHEAQKVLSLGSKNPPGDEALFHISLIYSHFANPKKDYAKSLLFLRRLLQDFPQSFLAEEARIWINLIQENERLNQTAIKSNQTIDRLNQTIEKLHKIIEESKKVDIEIEEKKREKEK